MSDASLKTAMLVWDAVRTADQTFGKITEDALKVLPTTIFLILMETQARKFAAIAEKVKEHLPGDAIEAAKLGTDILYSMTTNLDSPEEASAKKVEYQQRVEAMTSKEAQTTRKGNLE